MEIEGFLKGLRGIEVTMENKMIDTLFGNEGRFKAKVCGFVLF